MIRLLLALLLFTSPAWAQQGSAVGPNPPCSAFGTASGTCLQGASALGSPSSVGTLPAFTLGGTIAGGGNQLNNIVIGTTTPLAGSFTTLNASSTLTAGPARSLLNGNSEPYALSVNNRVGDGAVYVGATHSATPDLILSNNGGATILTVTAGGSMVIPATLNITTLGQTSVAQSGTVCYNSGTGLVTYDATLGCLASTMAVKDAWKKIAPQQALQAVLKMEPGSFVYKKDMGLPEGAQIGFNAEQMAGIDERLVSRDAEGRLRGVRYQQDSVLYAGAIQALAACQASWKCRIFGVGAP